MRGRPLSDVLGIELLDFDVTQPSSPGEQAELRRLFKAHHLLLVRGQKPSNEDQNRFTATFGPLSAMLRDGDAGYVSNKLDQNSKTGPLTVSGTEKLLWHADGAYGPHPGIGTSLLAKEVSPVSTPTLFANSIRALEKLPSDLRTRLESLHAVHMRDTGTARTSIPFREPLMPKDAAPGQIRAWEHPVIYQGPHLDERVLYVNELMTSHIAELEREESDALLEELFGYIYADDNVYTHYWQVDDLIIWDNIALQHCRPSDMGSAPRHLRRLSLDGWNTGQGVIEWCATGTQRDLAKMQRMGSAYS
jgi:taurine dioxygenase